MIITLNSHKAASGGLDPTKVQYIKRLQAYLTQMTYLDGKIDGIFGPATLEAVKTMQGDYSLVQDGIVGPKSWQKILPTVPLRASLGASFYDHVRKHLFNKLNNSQIAGIEKKLEVFREYNLSVQEAAYLFATSFHETGQKMQPVEEIRKGAGKSYGRRVTMKGAPYAAHLPIYYGRGDVQLTWYDNYDLMGKRLGLNLLEHPELALQTDISAKILVIGVTEGFFGRKLGNYIDNKGLVDYYNARRCVNILDKASTISGYALEFELALLAK